MYGEEKRKNRILLQPNFCLQIIIREFGIVFFKSWLRWNCAWQLYSMNFSIHWLCLCLWMGETLLALLLYGEATNKQDKSTLPFLNGFLVWKKKRELFWHRSKKFFLSFSDVWCFCRTTLRRRRERWQRQKIDWLFSLDKVAAEKTNVWMDGWMDRCQHVMAM